MIGWSLSASVLITPLVIPALLGLGGVARRCARLEAGVARGLIDARAGPGVPSPGQRVLALHGGDARGPFWRTQAYLLVRWLVGVPLAVAVFALLAASVGLIFAPVWVLTSDGAHIGGWHVHTVLQSLVFIPAGLLLLAGEHPPGRTRGGPFRPLASSLLAGRGHPCRARAGTAAGVTGGEGERRCHECRRGRRGGGRSDGRPRGRLPRLEGVDPRGSPS